MSFSVESKFYKITQIFIFLVFVDSLHTPGALLGIKVDIEQLFFLIKSLQEKIKFDILFFLHETNTNLNRK